MLGCLITLSPLDPTSGARQAVRICSVNDSRVTGLGGLEWEPCVTRAPSIGVQFWNGDFEQGNDPAQVAFAFNLAQARKRYPVAVTSAWMGCPVEVRVGKVGDPFAQWPVRFLGKVTDYAGDAYPAMSLRAAVDLEPLKANVLTATYAGTGGAEGEPDLKNRLKPLALGRPRNVEPMLIDAVNSVYQFSGYGPIEAVEALFERGSQFAPAAADYASYAALVTATIAPGRWATCLTEGLVRLGAPAAGVITGDVRGHAVGGVAPCGAGALALCLAAIAGLDTSLIAVAAFNALDAEGATNSDLMITDQVTLIDAVRQLILPCNWQVLVSNLGVLTTLKPSLAPAPALTLHAQGKSLPPVKSVVEQSVSLPYHRTVMAAQRNWRQQSTDEISFTAPLIDRGGWDTGTTYREGNYVTMPDGSRWLYVNPTPSAGHAPPIGSDVSAWWAGMSGPTQVAWSNVADPLGTKPQDNADVTSDNTSKDTAAVGGVPAAQVIDRIQAAREAVDAIEELTSKNVADIDALVETYGETASAAASASAAKASEDNAKAAATNAASARDLAVGAKTAAEAAQTAADQKARDAAQSASGASGSATTASGQATIATQKADLAGQSASTATAQADIATTKAGEASSSASRAATSETNAAGSSNSASSSATVSAKSASAATLAADFPLTFAQKGALYRSGGWGGGVPIPDSDFAGAVSGNVYKVGGAYGLAYVRPVPSKGRLLRYQARIRAVGADATLSTDFEYANSPTGPAAGGTFSGFRPLTVAAGWTDVEYPIDGRGTGWAWAYVMPLLRGTAGAGGTVEVEYFRTVDVTDRQAAADYAAASASSAATAGTKASDAGTSAAAALASKTSAETAAGSAATSASQASTSETNAAGSANTASSAQAVTSSVYQSALKATGDQEFVNGVDGYEIVAYGALADVMVLAVDNGRSNLIANKPGKRVGLVSKRRYPITSPTQKFELAASARLAAGPSGSDFYVGYLMFDAAGNRLPAAGIGNYPLFNGYAFANDEWVDSKTTIGKSDLAGHQLINPAAVSFAPAVFINDRNQNATAIYEVDYVTVRDVTAEVAANAAASSAATAGTKATEAGQLASAAQTSATNAQTFAKNSSDSAKAANDSFTSAQASSTAAGQYAQSASGSANSASTSAGNAKASAEASSGSAAVATDKAAQAASSASLAASYAGGLSGGNMLANSRWLDGLSSWEQVLDVPKFFWGRTNADFGLVEGEHYMGLLGQTRDGASAGAIISEWVTVEPGMTIQISAWLASRECVNSLMIQWGTAARAYLRDAASSEGVGNTHRGSASLSSFKRVGAQAVVPSDARCARFVVQKGAWQANPPNDQSWMFMTRPMMAKVPSGQSGLVDYVFAGPSGGLSAAAAAIDSNALVAAAANQAVAQRTTTLEATTGSQAARLTTTEQVAATALDRTSGARWSKEAVAGNGRAQLTVYAFDSNGNLQSGVDIIGNLTIRGDVFVDGTIYTSKLAPNAAQSIQWARSAGAVSLPANQQTRIMQLTFQKTEAGSTLDLLANLRMKSGDDITGVFRLINFNSGGGIEDSWPIWMVGANDNYQVPIALNWMATGWVPGTYTLAIDYFNQETDAPTWAEAGCTIKVQEIKR